MPRRILRYAVERIEERLLPPSRFARADRALWIRASLLAWVGSVVVTTMAVTGIVAYAMSRPDLGLTSLLLAAGAAGVVLIVRASTRLRWHAHALLVLLSGCGMALDLVAGGSGLGALALMPFVIAIAVLTLPRGDVRIWWALSLVVLTACVLAPDGVVGTSAFAAPLAASVGIALIVGALIASACAKLQFVTDAVTTEVGIDDEAAQRDRRRMDTFVAMPGDWYWETDDELRLTYLSPGFAHFLAITEGVVLGRSMECLLLGRFPGVRGLISLVRSMRRHLAFAHYLFAWNKESASFSFMRVRAWPAYTARGVFVGYRGSMTDVSDVGVRAETASESATHDFSDT